MEFNKEACKCEKRAGGEEKGGRMGRIQQKSQESAHALALLHFRQGANFGCGEGDVLVTHHNLELLRTREVQRKRGQGREDEGERDGEKNQEKLGSMDREGKNKGEKG